MIPYEVRQQHDEWGNAEHLLAPADAAVLEAGSWRRVSGDCTCETCAKLYYDHPPVLGALWLNRLCTGELVKL
ncbi:hypothetical protein HOT99_gp035 [Caulobacter phage CcrBL10]|uniref:Uncharacterized protein n=1 Tax=Caulobacter phage CcrBL10 TaxID=2283269 RepID=A0A385EC21_9CAUD|nr:hypothetical protein HOT99_gp035 [Caulobacter phage CcrBL10]AXQ68239.1 hypothetical protein CcrBL10_gp035 [Caulobacter phage CcrBL10]